MCCNFKLAHQFPFSSITECGALWWAECGNCCGCVYSLKKNITSSEISGPLELVNGPSNGNSDQLHISAANRTSTEQLPDIMAAWSAGPQPHTIHESVSPALVNNVDRQLSSSPAHSRHSPQYPQHLSGSTSPVYRQPDYSSHNGVGHMSPAARNTSPKPVIPVNDSRPMPHTASDRPFTSHVDRPSPTQPQLAVGHQYTQPAANDRYRHHGPTSVARELEHQYHIPQKYQASQSRQVLPTSDVDVFRNGSYREAPVTVDYEVVHRDSPTAQTSRISPQRDLFTARNDRGPCVERKLSFGNGPSRQNIQRNDSYELRHPSTDRSDDYEHERVRSGLLRSRKNNINDRLRPYGSQTVNDNSAAYRLRVGVSQSPQYSISPSHSQQNSERYQYPSPVSIVDQSVSRQPLPHTERRHHELRNPLVEPLYFRSRQVCTV